MKKLHPAVGITAMLTLVFLYAPMLAVAVLSTNANRYGVRWEGFTWSWYAKLLDNQAVLEATINTLVLALASTLVATVLGTCLALALSRYHWGKRLQATLETLLYVPVVVPDIILAAALVIAFSLLRVVSGIFEPGMLTMTIGHITFQIAFVALVVMSRLRGLGRDLEEAAYDLYANYPYLLRHVLLPLLTPGIVAGAMLAFTLSLDDFVISFFTAGNTQTLPLLIYAAVRRGVTPDIHALSTLIFLATVLLVLGSERLTRR